MLSQVQGTEIETEFLAADGFRGIEQANNTAQDLHMAVQAIGNAVGDLIRPALKFRRQLLRDLPLGVVPQRDRHPQTQCQHHDRSQHGGQPRSGAQPLCGFFRACLRMIGHG